MYGVRTPNYMGLGQMLEGDTVLLRLRLRQAQTEYSYLGPYQATSQRKKWVKKIENAHGIWQKIIDQGGHTPRWLKKYPWCVFLSPTHEFINDLRELSISRSVKACEPIKSPLYEEILSSLLQSEFLPDSRVNSYRTVRGVWVRSRAEYMIDNWFTERGIVTYYEKAIYLDSFRIVPDWFIPSIKVYLEYLGLKGDPNYDNSWRLKEKAYQKHKITYITLDEKDLVDLDFTIPSKIPQFKAKGILK